MQLSQERKGEVMVIAANILWSFFPIITLLTYSFVSPLFSLAWSTFFAAVFFAVILTLRKTWKDFKNISALKDMLMTALFIGILFYGLYFWGLQYTTAGNASIISLMEIFFTFLLFNVWKKEYMSIKHIIGALLMIVGAIIVLIPEKFSFYSGDFIILIAILFGPIGNYFQKKARKQVSAEAIMFTRSMVTFPCIFLFAYITMDTIGISGIKESLLLLLLNGIIFLGFSKILFIESIHRISVTKAISMEGLNPLLTLFFAFFILGEIPTVFQFLSFIPLFIGLILLTSNGAKELQEHT